MKTHVLSAIGILLLIGVFIATIQLAHMADRQPVWCERLGGEQEVTHGCNNPYDEEMLIECSMVSECEGDYTDFIDVIRK